MKKILIIDNSKFIGNVIKTRINKQSLYEVMTTQSLAKAQEYIEAEDVFMIVTNLTLEDADEEAILEFLKSSGIASIVFSTSIETQLIQNENYPNIVDYVFKDINGAIHICNLIDAISFGIGKKVLVVDDSKTSIQYLKKMLQKLLVDVSSAYNGSEALEYLQQNQDTLLLISDMNMPQMNGLELTKAIRANPKLSRLRIIITTGQTDNKTKIDLFKYGVNDVIYKPVVAEEMMYKTVNVLLEQKHLEDIGRVNAIADEHIISSQTDENGIITDASAAFCKISGYEKKELIGKSHSILRHEDMEVSVYKDLWETIKEGKTWQGEIKNRTKEGGFYWVFAIIEPFVQHDGSVMGYYAIRQDITDKKRIEQISITDGLTGIYNRRHFNDLFPKVINSAKRENELVCFLLMDIDHFKQYNDNYGHQKGDDVLIEFAASLKKSLHRGDDMAFRLGGEEFGIVYKATTKEKAAEFADIIRQNIQDLKIEHRYSSATDVITASMGLVAMDAKDIKDMDSVYKQADDLLYEAKENGRNRVIINKN